MKIFTSKYFLNILVPVLLALFPLLAIALMEMLNTGLTKVLYLLIFIGFFGYILKNPKIIFPLYAKLLFVFFIYVLLSDIILIEKQIDFSYFFSNKILLLLLFLLLIENIQIVALPEKIIIKIIKVVSLIAAIVIVIQVNNPFFLVKEIAVVEDVDLDSIVRYSSIYSYSGKMAILFVFVPSLSLVIAEELKNNKKSILLFWIIIGFIVSFLSGTRVIMANMIVLLGMIFYYKSASLLNVLKYTLFLTLAVISFVFVMDVAKIDYNRILTDRILTENDGGLIEGSAGTRLLAFELFPQFFKKSPLFGSGAEISSDLIKTLDSRSSQLHVGYLSYLYYYGLLGGCMYFIFMYLYTRKIYLNSKVHKNWGPFFGWIGFPIANLTLNYMVPFEAGILLCVLFDKYYLNCHNDAKKDQMIDK